MNFSDTDLAIVGAQLDKRGLKSMEQICVELDRLRSTNADLLAALQRAADHIIMSAGWEAIARQAEEKRDGAIDECNRLRALNAELVAALKYMVSADLEPAEPSEQTRFNAQLQQARAAIAKAGA